jgi:hypothetical protein
MVTEVITRSPRKYAEILEILGRAQLHTLIRLYYVICLTSLQCPSFIFPLAARSDRRNIADWPAMSERRTRPPQPALPVRVQVIRNPLFQS